MSKGSINEVEYSWKTSKRSKEYSRVTNAPVATEDTLPQFNIGGTSLVAGNKPLLKASFQYEAHQPV